jgi:hypothetical protein
VKVYVMGGSGEARGREGNAFKILVAMTGKTGRDQGADVRIIFKRS